MSKPNKREQWGAALKEDLREVLGLYDLQILEDDGLWLAWESVPNIWDPSGNPSERFVLRMAPFSDHVPWEDNRGAKKGTAGGFKRKS